MRICSFCGKNQEEVDKLITKDDDGIINICDKCVLICVEALINDNAFPIITRAAILKDGIIHVGLENERHHHILNNAKGNLKGEKFGDVIQGFITNEGNFVDREEGAKIAFKAGQTKELLRELYSEDLW